MNVEIYFEGVLCAKIRKRIADKMDGAEEYFCVDSKPIIGKISAFTVLQYINYIHECPIGRIKYALS